VTLGRWSYGIFFWHLAALDMVFPVLGRFAFSGDMAAVLTLTLFFTIALAAVSYALVESPCREALRGWEFRHPQRPRTAAEPARETPIPSVPPLDSAVRDAESAEPTAAGTARAGSS
jgi:peptidoglycan/LPS O-acetylase OafA/YrhL